MTDRPFDFETDLDLMDNAFRSLYGPEPNQEASRILGVTYLTVKRWRRGIKNVPAGIWAELGVALTNEAARLTALANECSAKAKAKADQ